MRTSVRSLWLPLVAAALCPLWLAPAASAATIDWVTVGDPGNAADTIGYGAVAYAYQISKYEVTNAQYAQFLNAKATSDPLELYDERMASPDGGIMRSGTPGSYSYAAVSGRESKPVNFVSFYDAVRFANWLHNGQADGDTETGAYTLQGGTATPSNGPTVERNVGALVFLPSEDEWYKAAFYSGPASSYFDYPAGTDTQTGCASPTTEANSAACDFAVYFPIDVGSYPGSPSPYGTFDQGGNIWEWNEGLVDVSTRGIRGGSYASYPEKLAASYRAGTDPTGHFSTLGFRVASIPEPGTGALVAAGLTLLAFAGRGSSNRPI